MKTIRYHAVTVYLVLFGVLGMVYADDSPLFEAVKNGDKTKIEALLVKGVNVNVKEDKFYTSTPLHYAVRKGNKDIVALLLARGAEVNVGDGGSWNSTPLHYAAEGGNEDIIALLLGKGAEVNVKDRKFFTPLACAVCQHQKGAIKLLLAHGADVMVTETNGVLLLQRAIDSYDLSGGIFELLLSKVPDINFRDAVGMTLLHRATMAGNIDVAMLLLSKGADFEARSDAGVTPLHSLSINPGSLDVVKLLLAKGANVNATDKSGVTPLHKAAEAGKKDAVELLLAKGAELNAKDNAGETPLIKAATGWRFWTSIKANKETFGLLLSLDKSASSPLPMEAQSAMEQGIAAGKKDDYLAAISHFEEARKVAPHDPLLLGYLGFAESKVPGRELRAICWLEAYLAASPSARNATTVAAEIANLKLKARRTLLALVGALDKAADLLPKATKDDGPSFVDPRGTEQDHGMMTVAVLLARAGNLEAADQRAGGIGNARIRTQAQAAMATSVALSGDLENGKVFLSKAVESAEKSKRLYSESHQDGRCHAFSVVVQAMADMGDAAGSRDLATRIEDAKDRCRAQVTIVRAQANAGDFPGAIASAEEIPVHFYRSVAQAIIARTAAECGDQATATSLLKLATDSASLAGIKYTPNSRFYHYEDIDSIIGYLFPLKVNMLTMKAIQPPPPQSVENINRENRNEGTDQGLKEYEENTLYLDLFLTQGLIGLPYSKSLEHYETGGFGWPPSSVPRMRLGLARAALGDYNGALEVVSSGPWTPETHAAIADALSLTGNRLGAKMHLMAAQTQAKSIDRNDKRRSKVQRQLAEVGNRWIAANDYLLNDSMFTDLPAHLNHIPDGPMPLTFAALADTALGYADALQAVLTMRHHPIEPTNPELMLAQNTLEPTIFAKTQVVTNFPEPERLPVWLMVAVYSGIAYSIVLIVLRLRKRV